MQRDELQIKVNQKLQEISMELKTIPNIGSDYMEYISALICVMFENYEEFKLILIKYENDEKEIVNFLDRELYEIKWNYNAKLLFKNIRFSDKLNQIDYMKIKNVLRELNLLILDLKSAKQEGKNILAEAFEYIIMKSAQSNENPFRKGAFYTPKGLIKIMLKLLKMDRLIHYLH